MRRILSILALSAAALVPCASAAPLPGAFRAGAREVVALVAPDAVSARAGAIAPRDQALAAALARAGVTRMRFAGGARAGNVLVLGSDDPAFDPWAAAAALRASGAVRAAAPDLPLTLFGVTPNDTFYVSKQWWAQSAPAGAVHLPDAWAITTGDSAVTIGIMDTGVDMGHPDLAARIWTNPGEIAGNGLDDDGDGYVDDVHGWDFGLGSNDPDPRPIFESDPPFSIDVGFHGTFVAGLAAAASNNAQGIAGVDWKAKIVPLRVADSSGAITLAPVAAAFAWATQHHLSVLNMSFGGPDSANVLEDFFQPLVDDAVAAGVVCVAAAGNDSSNTLNFPAACNGVLGVGATNSANQRSAFSSWGPTVRIGAPGQLMWSCLCRNYTIDSLSQLLYYLSFSWDGTRPYMEGDGTSFAAPIVSGAAALVRAKFPSLTGPQVVTRLIDTGDAVAYDHPIGPKLNVANALAAPLAVPTPMTDRTLSLAASPIPMRTTCTLRFTLPTTADTRLTLLDVQGRTIRVLLSQPLPAGTHSVTWDGADATGHTPPPGLYLARLTSGRASTARRIVRVE